MINIPYCLTGMLSDYIELYMYKIIIEIESLLFFYNPNLALIAFGIASL